MTVNWDDGYGFYCEVKDAEQLRDDTPAHDMESDQPESTREIDVDRVTRLLDDLAILAGALISGVNDKQQALDRFKDKVTRRANH